MATKTYYLSGVTEWAKLTKPDTKYNKEGIYSLDLFLDEASWDKYQKSGAQLKIKERNGQKFISLKRPARKMIKDDIVDLGPPAVLDQDGVPFDEVPVIGNGSRITCKVNIYDTMKGKGHTLEAVRVDDLVVYERPEEGEAF